MIIRIESWKDVLTTSEVESDEDLDLYLSSEIKILESSCITGSKPNNKLTVHYNGLIKDWDKIIKGGFGSSMEYKPFWDSDIFNEVIIHCRDGEIKGDRYLSKDKELCLQYMKENDLI